MKNYSITVNGNLYNVTVEEGSASSTPVAAQAPVFTQAPVAAPVATPVAAPVAQAPVAAPVAAPAASSQGSVVMNAPMPGKIIAIKASVGQAVKRGDVVLILEAMKMENEVVAPNDGTIASINVGSGDSIEAGDVLATLN